MKSAEPTISPDSLIVVGIVKINLINLIIKIINSIYAKVGPQRAYLLDDAEKKIKNK